MTQHSRPLLRFVLTVIALLPLCFLIWWYFGTVLAAPAVWLIDLALTAWLDGVIQVITLDGTSMTVFLMFGELNGVILPAAEAGNQLAFVLDTKTLSYSIPFYAALHFATPMEAPWERFFRAVLVLWILLALGLMATTLKDLMLGMGEPFLSMTGVPPADGIALAYQFSTLIVPPLAPILLWAYGVRDVPAFRALLPPSVGSDAAAEAADDSR
jgi:hypothetical protein